MTGPLQGPRLDGMGIHRVYNPKNGQTDMTLTFFFGDRRADMRVSTHTRTPMLAKELRALATLVETMAKD